MAEQNQLCAYCVGAIRFGNMKLEHWCPRATCKDRKLDYTNFLAVCEGCYNSGEYFHCDTSKGDKVITLDPQVPNHIQIISYLYNSGKIESANAVHQNEIDEVLKLNIAPLKKSRKKIIAVFKTGIHHKYKGKKANYQKELKKWQGKNIPFGMIVEHYLEKKLA